MDAERCPVCGTVGRVVSSDEGTSHFLAAPAVTETDPIDPRYYEPCRDFDRPSSCYTNDGTGLWCEPCEVRRAYQAALATPAVTETDLRAAAHRIHAILAADPLLPDCGGTHTIGYATCVRLAAALAATSDTEEEPRHPYTCGICSWGRDGAYHDKQEYRAHMTADHPSDTEEET